MEPIAELQNVSAWRGGTQVFRNLSLELKRGDNSVVLGPNGAGKSTLLKLLAREIYPEARASSRLRLFGRDRWNIWELRTRLGVVSHDLQIGYPARVSGLDVVISGFHASLGVWPHQHVTKIQQEVARGVLERMEASHLADKAYATLSTGEQRRLLLGRALVHDPGVLVLDEPTSGLDPKACFRYIECVRELMRSGKTVLLVTHHLHEIPPEIERVILLRDGEIVADGLKSKLLTNGMLSRTFDTPIEVVQANGFYQALPGKGLPVELKGVGRDESSTQDR